ncbi:MAG: zeta toxin family protein [Gammaproteobacteria bacterium]|nr:zeta toxin family protein [Gammaproteobacteria bacterium]
MPTEKNLIRKDLRNISDLCFSQAKRGQKKSIYVATAGGPGASKTTILESYLHDHPGFVYVDPDQRALKFMINTYLQDLTNYQMTKGSCHSVIRGAYVKWRAASNYISNKILNDAFSNRLAIAHGTTSTSIHMESFYKKLHDNGYKIILLLCASPAKNRLKAIVNRETKQCFVQATKADTKQKGKMFYENFPVYFKFADEIQFFWIDDFNEGWVKVGSYTRKKGLKKNHSDFAKFEDSYEVFRINYPHKKLPGFPDLVLGEK